MEAPATDITKTMDKKFNSLKQRGEKWWKLKINLAALDKHVPDAEMSNRTLQDRVCVSYHRLPYKSMPRVIIRQLCHDLALVYGKYMVPEPVCKKGWYVNTFYSQLIVNKEMISFKKHLRFSFGDYDQELLVNKHESNDNQSNAKTRDTKRKRAR